MEALETEQSNIRDLRPPRNPQPAHPAQAGYVHAMQTHRHIAFLLMLAAITQYVCGQQKQEMKSALLAKSRYTFSAVAWSPDGRYFASAWNKFVLIWDSDDNTVTTICGGHTEQVTSVSFSNNGSYMLTSSDDGSVITYNLRKNYDSVKIMPRQADGSKRTQVQSAAFSPDGSSVYFSRDGGDISEFLHLILTDEISSITYSYSGHSANVYSVQTARDRRLMLTTAVDGTAILWNTRTHRQIQSFDVYAESRVPAALSPDGGSFLSATSSDTITLRSLDGAVLLSVREPRLPVNCAAFTADGTHFALALHDGGIAYYNARTGAEEMTFSTQHDGEAGTVLSLAFSPDGEYLVAGTRNGCLFRWSIKGGRQPDAPMWSDTQIQQAIQSRATEMPEQEYDPEKKQMTPSAPQQEERAPEENQAADNAAPAQGRPAQAQTPPAAPAPAATSPIPRHQLSLLAGVSSQPSDYFTPSIELAVEYRCFAFYPLYFGGATALGDALPSKDYPYTYQNAGQTLRQPSMYRLSAQGLAGIAYYFERIQVTALMEVRAGMSARMLWNTQFKPAATTSLYPSAAAGLGIGFLWHGVTGRFGVEYDTRFEFLYSGYIGYSLRLGRRQQ